MRGKRHSDDLKARVIAALLAGQAVAEISQAQHLDEATIRNWKRTLPREKLTQVNELRQHNFGNLVGEYLTSILTTLKAQADHVRKPEVLAGYSATEIATLHETFASRGLQLLEAAERARDEGDP